MRFVEAMVDALLDDVMSFEMSPQLLSLHPSIDGVEELAQVQLTRFSCGSLAVGCSMHHHICDGHSGYNFLFAWGKACQGIGISPLPTLNRGIFLPRNPPKFEHEHIGREFTSKQLFSNARYGDDAVENIIVHKVHFTVDFLAKIKAWASMASSTMNNSSDSETGPLYKYSTFESLMAHLWRSLTKARGLNNCETTKLRIAVDGRRRLNPKAPPGYFGNLVLWAFPKAVVKDLLSKPLCYAAKLIHDEVLRIDDNYFRSFIDFAAHKATVEDLVPTADAGELVLSPDLEVDSWLAFPYRDFDFGTGSPFICIPSPLPIEGLIILLPSAVGEGSIDAFVPLFKDNLATFEQCCYNLDVVARL